MQKTMQASPTPLQQQQQQLPSDRHAGALLTWQQRYLRMSPDDLHLTLWDIPAGAVVVSRPSGAGRQICAAPRMHAL